MCTRGSGFRHTRKPNRYTGFDNIATMVPGIVWQKAIYLRTEK